MWLDSLEGLRRPLVRVGWLDNFRFGRARPWGVIAVHGEDGTQRGRGYRTAPRGAARRIVGLTLYGAGHVRRIRLGTRRWADVEWIQRIETESLADFHAGAIGNHVLCLARPDRLIALDETSGKERWTLPLPRRARPRVERTPDDRLVVSYADGRTIVVSPDGGHTLSEHDGTPSLPREPLDGDYAPLHEVRATASSPAVRLDHGTLRDARGDVIEVPLEGRFVPTAIRPTPQGLVVLVRKEDARRGPHGLVILGADLRLGHNLPLPLAEHAALAAVDRYVVVQLWDGESTPHRRPQDQWGMIHVLLVDLAAGRIVVHLPNIGPGHDTVVRDSDGELTWRGTL